MFFRSPSFRRGVRGGAVEEAEESFFEVENLFFEEGFEGGFFGVRARNSMGEVLVKGKWGAWVVPSRMDSWKVRIWE